ncbi:hypothetical protein A7A76_10635 [Lysobacter enzymogenes]|uniref:hypothetical protein n=1 Tax=Lysobacter enzymogenes TaxID=69 RepID=UPI0019CFDFC0|nr:hypothetical protein [Lysobacter enzymogenes]MBN7135208.1 hypothetical protein [Lysobacter enzymogenes]
MPQQSSPLTMMGTFLLASAHAARDAKGYLQGHEAMPGGGQRIVLRSMRKRYSEPDPPDCLVWASYRHPADGGPFDMTLSAEHAASLAGAWLACEIRSNYPDLALSVPRTALHDGLRLHRAARLPPDFYAHILLSYWSGDARPTPDAALIVHTSARGGRGAPVEAELKLHPYAADED